MDDGKMDNVNPRPVYVVLGATGGIGSELCRRLSERLRPLPRRQPKKG